MPMMKYIVATCLAAIVAMGVIPVCAAPEYGPITDGLQMSAQPNKPIYHAGDTVHLDITLHNASDKMAFLGASAFDLAGFSFTLKDARGVIQPLTAYGKQLLAPPTIVSANFSLIVPPGGDRRYQFNLSHLYDLTLAGGYTLDVRRGIPSENSDLSSNVVRFRIAEDAASYSGPVPVSTPHKMREYVYLVSTFGERDQAHGVVSQYQVDADGTLSPVTPFTVPVGNYAREIVTVPNRPYAYVANRSDGTISQFRISVGGALVPLSPPIVATGSQPQSLVIDPAGRFLYFFSGNDSEQCRIGSDGQLTLLTKGNFRVPTVFQPTGHFAYSASWSAYQYQVDPDGRLLPLSPTYVPTGDSSNPGPMTIDPAGKYVYALTLRAVAYKNAVVPSQYTDYIAQFKIGADGTLSALSPKGLDCNGFQIQFLAVDPTGRFVYAGLGSNHLMGYRITSSGSLTPLAPTVLRGLLDPTAIAFEQSGRFAYVASDHTNSIAQFKIGPKGDLLPLALDIGFGGAECASLATANVSAPSETGAVTGGLQLAARLDQSGFRSGQPIAFTVVARNLTNEPLSLGTQNGPLAGFTLIAQTSAGKALPLTLYGEAAQGADGARGPALMIAPKSQRQFRFLLTRLFNFTSAGPYTILAQCRVQQVEPANVVVSSNALHFDVNNPGPDTYYFDSLSAADKQAAGYNSMGLDDYEAAPFPAAPAAP